MQNIFKHPYSYYFMNLNEIKKKLEIVKNDKQVIAVLLFGSYLKGRYRDIDVCLVLDKKYSNKDMTEKRIRYYGALPDILDIQIFQQLPLYIRKKILEKHKILFCRDEDRLYEIAYETIKDFNMFEKGYNYYLESILKNEK